MEHIKGDQSSAFKGVEITLTCEDCGQSYDGKAQALLEGFVGSKGRRRCSECREKLIKFQLVQDHERHLRFLTYHRQEWLNSCGIPPKYMDKTFENYDPLGLKAGKPHYDNSARVKACREYASAFPVDSHPKGAKTLLIVSQTNGTGKTHLASAVLREIIGRCEDFAFEKPPYRFYTAGHIRNMLQDAKRFSSGTTVSDLYRQLSTLRLLVLDDVGKEKLSGYEADEVYTIYYTLINERYNLGLPMVITSNLSMEPWEKGGISLVDIVGLAGKDRLMEMSGGTEILIEGESRR